MEYIPNLMKKNQKMSTDHARKLRVKKPNEAT